MMKLSDRFSKEAWIATARPLLDIALRLWRRIENTVFGVILFLVVVYLLLQLPFIQNWLIHRIAGYLSDELKTEVRIGHVDIAFFDNLVLDELYVADLHGDTLLYAGQVVAGLNTNIFSVLDNNLEFNELSLKNARLHLRRYHGEYDYNLQFLLDYFDDGTSKKPKKKKKPFPIRVRNLRLHDVEVIRQSEVSGQSMRFVIQDAAARINKFDGPSKIAEIHSVTLDGFTFDFEDHPSRPMPPRPTIGSTVPVPESDSVQPAVKRRPFTITVGEFKLRNGRFDFDRFFVSPERTTLPEVMDYDHLKVSQIGIEADSITFDADLVFRGRLRQLTATEQSGFQIKKSWSREVYVCDTLAALYGCRIETDQSSVGDTFMLHYSRYRDFLRFNSSVSMEARFNEGSRICLGDIRHFANAVAKNDFFDHNGELLVSLKGRVDGKVNSLNGRGIEASVGDHTFIECDFDGDDMARGADQMRLSIEFERLQSSIPGLKTIIPQFQPGTVLDKLGQIRYAGRYDLFFASNHILNGAILTNLGNGTLDMKLDLTEGIHKATYSGQLNMRQFDLGQWTGNGDLGKSSFRINIADGSTGLTLASVNAGVSGVIDTLIYRNYAYRQINMNGHFSDRLFEGKLGIHDPNIDLDFDGTVNMKDTIPQFRFSADLKRLDMGRLNLVDQDMVASGRVEKLQLSGKDIDDLTGAATIRDIRIIQDLEDRQIVHRLDSVSFVSTIASGGDRHFAVNSDVLSAYMDGRFQLNSAPRHLLQMMAHYYPDFSRQLKLSPYDSTYIDDRYEFGVWISNTRDLTRLFDDNLDTLRSVLAEGWVDGRNGYTKVDLTAPRIKYGGMLLEGLSLNWESEQSEAHLQLDLPASKISGYKLQPVSLSGQALRDLLFFNLQTRDIDTSTYIRSVELKGALSVIDSLWQVRFESSNFNLFNQQWFIEEDNFLRLGQNFLATQNFGLYSGYRRILLDSINYGRGVRLTTSNFDLNFLNEIVPSRGLNYRGRLADFDVVVSNVFELEGVEVFLSTDTVFLNNQPYGRVDGNLSFERWGLPLEWTMRSRNLQEGFSLHGGWLPADAEKAMKVRDTLLSPGALYSQVEAINFPMNILQQFVPGISNTAGVTQASVRFDGNTKGKKFDLGMNGWAKIDRGQFEIDYLNSLYYLENQQIELTNYKIWANNCQVYSINNNQRSYATVNGGLRHNYFKDWRIDCRVASLDDKFVLLNTTKEDNPLYYGKGIGKFDAKFSGTFSRTDIKIAATTGNNSRLYIPLTEEAETGRATFIQFRPPQNIQPGSSGKTSEKKKFQAGDLRGLSLEMDLTITDQAEVQMIFDEQAGDIVKGRGTGDISLIINREGEFKMYGTYLIRRGEYLFTLLNLVNKPFAVKEGGSIIWYGDPYGAQIDIDATYDENTPVYNLIRDELALIGNNDATQQEAAKATRVVVTMHLTGDLFKPDIGFDLEFPNVSSQLRAFTDNKLRLLHQDPNEMNRQIFSLVVFGSFFPPPNTGAPQLASYVSSSVNTLTQVLTSQLSNYISGLAAEWFGGSVSSIDFNIAYNDYSDAIRSGDANLQGFGRELQLRLSSGFANDRVTVEVGSQFGQLERPGQSQSLNGFLGEDVVVQIQLTESRKWRLKIYQRIEPDLAGGALRQRYGVGLAFQREYDTFDEMFKGAKKAAPK